METILWVIGLTYAGVVAEKHLNRYLKHLAIVRKCLQGKSFVRPKYCLKPLLIDLEDDSLVEQPLP